MQLDKFGDSLDNFNTTLIKSDTRLEAIKRGQRKKNNITLNNSQKYVNIHILIQEAKKYVTN